MNGIGYEYLCTEMNSLVHWCVECKITPFRV